MHYHFGLEGPPQAHSPFDHVVFLWPVRSLSRCIVESRYSTDHYLESGKTRTFKPRKDVPEGTKQYQLRKYAEATLVGARVSTAPGLVAQPHF